MSLCCCGHTNHAHDPGGCTICQCRGLHYTDDAHAVHHALDVPSDWRRGLDLHEILDHLMATR